MFVSRIYIMKTVRYIQFSYKRDWLWLRMTRISGDIVIGRVWNRPINLGLPLGQRMGIQFKDVIDT